MTETSNDIKGNLVKRMKCIWTEKYRAKRLEDLLLPDRVINRITSLDTHNTFIYYSSPGTGKTTAAKVISLENDFDTLFINASINNGIDEVRERITTFCKTSSFTSSKKMVILDEFDNFSEQGFSALRALVEEFYTVTFIMTCNYINKVPDAILSRALLVDFSDTSDEEKKVMIKKRAVRLKYIIGEETKDIPNLTFTDESLVYIAAKYYPDMRECVKFIADYIGAYMEKGDISLPKEVTKEELSVFSHTSSIHKYSPLVDLIVNKDTNAADIYKFVIGNYSGRIRDVFSFLARSFVKIIMDDKGPKYSPLVSNIHIVVDVIAKGCYEVNVSVDETITLLSVLYKLNTIAKR